MTAKDWQSVCLSKYRELLDYFGKKIAEGLSRFTGFSDVFFLKKSEMWVKNIASMLSL